jgi:hypothetical protein
MPDLAPEAKAREQIDALLIAAGWTLQSFTYEELLKRDKAEIADDLEAALEQFETIAEDLKR